MLEIKPLASQFSVSPQILLDDLSVIAELGYKSIINNRPDGEASDQPDNHKLQKKCQELGLEYQYMPVIPGNITTQNVQDMRDAISKMPKPILAFCRTGTRSCLLWSGSAEDNITLAQRIEKAGTQGYLIDINQITSLVNG
ncbi:MAG: TIGR01244 family sulfur transferase [Psychromonas sp.]